MQFDYLLANIVNMKTFILDWLEFGEKIGHLAVEGGDQFWDLCSDNNQKTESQVFKVYIYMYQYQYVML